MRVLDVLIAFPSLVLALVIAEYLGPSELNVIWAISFFAIPAFARLARRATLRLREQDLHRSPPGCPAPATWRILLRHIVPERRAPAADLRACSAARDLIILEAALSFLGLGVRPRSRAGGT